MKENNDYKVGDKVKVIASIVPEWRSHEFPIGTIVEVKGVSIYGDWVDAQSIDKKLYRGWNTWRLLNEEIEPYVEKAEVTES